MAMKSSMFTNDGQRGSLSPVTRTVISRDGPDAAASMDCSAVGENICYEDSGGGQTQWVNVGPGRGNFEKVQQYMPVQGGSFAPVQVGREKSLRWQCVFGSVCCIAILGAAVAAAIIAARGGFSGSSPFIEQDVRIETPPSHNCSSGSWTALRTSDIQQAFKAFKESKFEDVDVNGDGKLSKTEIADAVSAKRAALPQCMVQKLAPADLNLDGDIVDHEFSAALPQAYEEAAFDLVDSNCDGHLSNAELTNLRATSNLPPQTKTLLGSADVDADTKLSKEEFMAAIQKSSMERGSAGNELWSQEKKWWCCHTEGLGCETSLPFDCKANKWDWQKAWSQPKKEYCCKLTGVGCAVSGPAYDCTLSYDNWQSAWPEEKKAYCCEREKRGCPVSKPYDCKAGLPNWEKGWSVKKKLWCCDNENLGCPEEPFDCDAEEERWQVDWTAGKKAFCCKTQNKGCAEVLNPTGVKPLYNCRENFDHWQTRWTEGQQEYCCSQYGRGCKETTGAPKISEPFDCEAGYSNWKAGWSEAKKVWCCSHYTKGCDHAEEFNCYAGYDGSGGSLSWKHTWSDAKKFWCCKTYSKGCESSKPFDCEAGAWNWQKGWSENKKAWCCENERKGCVSHHEVEEMNNKITKTFGYDDCHDGQIQAWSDKKKNWCCLSKHVGCPSEPFDCEAGLSNWVMGWSAPKKEWCCHHHEKGCAKLV